MSGAAATRERRQERRPTLTKDIKRMTFRVPEDTTQVRLSVGAGEDQLYTMILCDLANSDDRYEWIIDGDGDIANRVFGLAKKRLSELGFDVGEEQFDMTDTYCLCSRVEV